MNKITPKAFIEHLFDGNPPQLGKGVVGSLSLAPGLDIANGGPLFDDLPWRHKDLLELSNGLDMLKGSYRLFGFGQSAGRDMTWWNALECWRFAWGERAEPFVLFGESILGNQFAYLQSELAAGEPMRVFELNATTFDVICYFNTFDEFLIHGFLNGVTDDAYHARIRKARKRHGRFPWDQQLAYLPSPLLAGGRTDVQELVLMSARASMTINGDLWAQLAHRQSLDGLQGLEPYTDDQGRERIRVLWA